MLGEQHEVGAHQPAGLGGVVAEQGAHLHPLADRQQREHRLAALLVELADDVGGVVGSHPREDLGDLLVGAVLEELALVVVVELLEHVGLELAVVVADGLDDLLALVPRGGLDEVGDLRGVELGELRVGHAQAHGGDVADERLHVGPVEELAGRDVRAERLGQQPPQAPARAGVDAHDAPRARDQRQLDLVRAHEPRPLDVDQLTVEQVLAAAPRRDAVRSGAGRASPCAARRRRGRSPRPRSTPRKERRPATVTSTPVIGG